MRIEYQYRDRIILAAGQNKMVYGERVKPGWILKVLTCFLHMPNSKIADLAEILIERNGLELEIRARARDAAKQGLSTRTPFYVGENQRIIGRSVNSVIGDELCLNVIGEMIPLKRWRKGKV